MGKITWRAVYDDGSSLPQIAAGGLRHRYQDIERDRLVCFDLLRGDAVLVRVDMRDDSGGSLGPKRLIWRMRKELNDKGHRSCVHLAGWQRLVNGRNVQAIAYVFDNGAVVLGGQFNDADPLMYPVVELGCEAV